MTSWSDSLFWNLFDYLPFVVFIFIGFVFLMFIITLVKGAKRWSSNNAAQELSEECTAVTKRTEVWGGSGDMSSKTAYYVTFEFQNGERKELEVKGEQYGLIVEGDRGRLVYQGTRFKSFERLPAQNSNY
ncbi:DUF2500 domain-containing protein [Paenibacillus medicaginis]|uniref:DUF2500 domain-containing protein n=1 Tax=Paenibacillus medicaginis TaxID=1470560 RepID=A0ABV5BX07_9BACL